MQQDSFEVNTLDIQKLVTARQVFFRKREFCVAAKKSQRPRNRLEEKSTFFFKKMKLSLNNNFTQKISSNVVENIRSISVP